MNPVYLRTMTAADLDAVLAIAAALPQAPHWPPAAYLAALAPNALLQRICLVAAEQGSEMGSETILGFAVASLLGGQAELESIAVVARSQRQGVGKRILERLLAELGREKVTEVLLEVRASNLRALSFYEALGFQAVGRRPRYYVDPVEDAVLMSRPL